MSLLFYYIYCTEIFAAAACSSCFFYCVCVFFSVFSIDKLILLLHSVIRYLKCIVKPICLFRVVMT